MDALFKHLAKEQASKSSLLEEEDIFSLVRAVPHPSSRQGPQLNSDTVLTASQVVALKKIPGHGSAKPHRMCVTPAPCVPRAHTAQSHRMRHRTRNFAFMDSPSHGHTAA